MEDPSGLNLNVLIIFWPCALIIYFAHGAVSLPTEQYFVHAK